MKPDTSDIRTSDLYLAAFLHVSGLPLFATPRGADRRVTFVLSDPAKSGEALKQSYYDGTGVVSAIAFADAIKNFKGLCHNA